MRRAVPLSFQLWSFIPHVVAFWCVAIVAPYFIVAYDTHTMPRLVPTVLAISGVVGCIVSVIRGRRAVHLVRSGDLVKGEIAPLDVVVQNHLGVQGSGDEDAKLVVVRWRGRDGRTGHMRYRLKDAQKKSVDVLVDPNDSNVAVVLDHLPITIHGARVVYQRGSMLMTIVGAIFYVLPLIMLAAAAINGNVGELTVARDGD